jgi:hypothetical protein
MSNQIDSGEMRDSYKKPTNYCFTLAFFHPAAAAHFSGTKGPRIQRR